MVGPHPWTFFSKSKAHFFAELGRRCNRFHKMFTPTLRSCLGRRTLQRVLFPINCITSLCCGFNYLFSAISVPLSTALSGRSVEMLGSATDIGAYRY
jgi:hypothetical protein